MKTFNKSDREYKTFVYRNWDSCDVWCSLLEEHGSALLLAQELFWQKHSPCILAEINEWRQQGWELTCEPAATAINLQKTERWETDIAPSDILLWILTLGLALITQLALGDPPRRYVTYRPTEFHIQMVRSEQQVVQVAA